ncbi:glycoside hydrolase family 88/105 protein [Lapidilactobacillus bayanensis]|uniref:glycoside hydrolase family 88/105 protein n=1 Tax=Lapidilactobacillus bayanensis TaxID=2485998 RepID=UPI001CDC055B|nr:glycoside hydrolase family 88 protein [Lapidilactobacillus bayanensis]
MKEKNLDKVVMSTINLVVDKMLNLKEPDKAEFQLLSAEKAKKIGYYPRDFGMEYWDWPQGVGLFGLSMDAGKYDLYIKKWIDKEIDKGLPAVNINTTCPMLTVMNYPQYHELSIQWAEQIVSQLPRTSENGLEHITTGTDKSELHRMNNQIWADTVFMAILFLAKMGKQNHNKKWSDEALYQMLLHTKYLVDRKTGLFYHGWDFTNSSNFGGNFWCRGNSWLTMGIPLFLEIVGDDIPASNRLYLLNLFENQVDALMRMRDGKTKLWHTIVDDSTSYIETSGSAGIIAGIFLGIKNGFLNKETYQKFCYESIEGLVDTVDTDGTVRGVSAGTVISENSDDYKKIIIQPMAYGQSLLLCALNGYIANIRQISK